MAKAQRLPSGNYRVRVTDPETGSRKSFTAETKREAELAALEWLSGKKTKSIIHKTIGECVDDYISSKENILSPTTIDGYRRCKKNCLDGLCSIHIDKLTPLDVQKYFNHLALSKSPKTVRNAHGLLMSVLNVYAPDLRLHTTLPAVQKRIKQLPDVRTVIGLIVGSDIELPCMLAIWLGLRMSEIRGVKKSDIHGDVLTIQRTVVTITGQHIEKSATKTYESTRQLRLPAYVMSLIDRLPEEQEYLTEKNASYIYKHFQKLLKESDTEHMTFHDLRHLNASAMLALGIPDKYAMERGGWSSPDIMRSVYQHTFTAEREAVDLAVDNYFQSILDDLDTKTDTK